MRAVVQRVSWASVKVDGNILPIYEEGTTHEVEVWLK